MKHAFKRINFGAEKLSVINTANRVVEQYAAAGYEMTVRQLYYQLIAQDLLPDSWMEKVAGKDGAVWTKNTQRNYSKIVTYIDDGRMCGIIDWDHIVDRTRSLRTMTHWNNAEDRVRSAYRTFRLDKWENQPVRLEVWVEKEAMEGVVARVCQRHDVDFFCCRGYPSQSSVKEAADRLLKYREFGQGVVILHLGDHDPSGIDMTRDITDRLYTFMYGEELLVDRLALNIDQVKTYNPPPNFAKKTDSRFQVYELEFGDECWELDALQPDVIDALIENAILSNRDDDLWDEKVEEEKREGGNLFNAWVNWDSVTEFLRRS